MKLFRGCDNSDFFRKKENFLATLKKMRFKKLGLWKTWIVIQIYKRFIIDKKLCAFFSWQT